jgi:hypothetical protein
MRAIPIAGISGTGFAAISWAIPVLIPQADPWIAQIVLYVGLSLLALSALAWFFQSREGGEQNDQTVNGDGNTQVGGNYTVNNYAPVKVAEPTTTPPNQQIIADGLERLMREMEKSAPPPRNIYEYEKREKALRALRELDDKSK